jgi:hypothetical protein
VISDEMTPAKPVILTLSEAKGKDLKINRYTKILHRLRDSG